MSAEQFECGDKGGDNESGDGDNVWEKVGGMKVVVKNKRKRRQKEANKGTLEFKSIEMKLLETIFKNNQHGISATKRITSTKQIKSEKNVIFKK